MIIQVLASPAQAYYCKSTGLLKSDNLYTCDGCYLTMLGPICPNRLSVDIQLFSLLCFEGNLCKCCKEIVFLAMVYQALLLIT